MAIYGTKFNNTLNGTSIGDTIYGLGGDDIINGLNGDDIIYGDWGSLSLPNAIKGVAGDDTIHGNNGNDKLYGEDGNDKLYGDSGIDTLSGGKGTNHLTGGAGGGSGIPGAPGDIYNLTGKNTIHIAKGDSPFELVNVFGSLGPKTLTGFDSIFNFSKDDKLDMPKDDIMKDTDGNGNKPGNGNGIIDGKGGDFGSFDKYSSVNGKIRLFDTDDNYVKIDTVAKAGDAYRYLKDNCLPENLDRIGAIRVDVKVNVHGAPNVPGVPTAPQTVVFLDHKVGGIEVALIGGDVTGYITDGHHII